MRNCHWSLQLNLYLYGLINIDVQLSYFGVGIVVRRHLVRDDTSVNISHVNVYSRVDIIKA